MFFLGIRKCSVLYVCMRMQAADNPRFTESKFEARNEEERGFLDRYVARGYWAPMSIAKPHPIGLIVPGPWGSASRIIKAHRWIVIRAISREEFMEAARNHQMPDFPYCYRVEVAD